MDDSSPATKADITLVKTDMSLLKTDVSLLKTDMSLMKADITALKANSDLVLRAVQDMRKFVYEMKADILRTVRAEMQILKQTLEGEMRQLGKELRGEIQDVRVEMQDMKKKLYETDDQILDNLISIDKRLSPAVKDHEKRIRVLERQAAAA